MGDQACGAARVLRVQLAALYFGRDLTLRSWVCTPSLSCAYELPIAGGTLSSDRGRVKPSRQLFFHPARPSSSESFAPGTPLSGISRNILGHKGLRDRSSGMLPAMRQTAVPGFRSTLVQIVQNARFRLCQFGTLPASWVYTPNSLRISHWFRLCVISTHNA